MDYLTRATNRKELRSLSALFRHLFGVEKGGSFPVLEILDKIPEVFTGSDYSIVEDKELPANVPAQCILTGDETFEIQIKESVYEGAYTRNVGGYRAHILHEVCHAFLYMLGFRPIVQRSFKNGQIAPYSSVEWQAKALCGEIMMPYNETADMSEQEIMRVYGVSEAQAHYRKKY